MGTSRDVLVQMFQCCLADEQSAGAATVQRHKIDRTMIGNPTDFRHTAHIGSADVGGGGVGGDTPAAPDFNQIQNQMRSKGGYEIGGGERNQQQSLLHSPLVVNARSIDEVRRQ
jgi:hypothetical protein